MTLENQIEAILLFKNEPLHLRDLSKMLNEPIERIEEATINLQSFYKNRGFVVVKNGEEVALGTHPKTSELIESLQKVELSRDLGRAGLETLSIVLYKGPVSRREIDYIRGVNSGFILRNLLVRGLIEKSESTVGERSFSYKPTLELMRFLGVTNQEELPEFEIAFKKIEEFAKNNIEDKDA